MKYAITDLGKNITPTALNNQGQVVGYRTTADDHRQAVTYYKGRIRYLGTFGGTDSEAKGINDRGHIVGVFTTNGDNHGFALLHRGRFVDLFSEAEMFNATGINNYDVIIGQKVGAEYEPYPFTYNRVILYDHGIVTDISQTGIEQGEGNLRLSPSIQGFNNLGQAVLFKGLCGSYECDQTFFFNNGIFTTFLAFRASDINDRGQIVGCGESGYELCKAFLVENGIRYRISDLGGLTSNGSSINNLGQIVGVAKKPLDYADYPFIHYKGTATELKKLLPFNTPWTLRQAIAINDRGQIIGTGLLRGEKHAFLLTPLVQTVEIDIKPHRINNKVDLQPNSQLRVAVLGSSVFDAASIRPTSVKLTGNAIGLRGRGDPYLYKIKDVNGDGYIDFISFVFIDQVAAPPGSSTQLLTLEAATFDGKRIEGMDSVLQR